MPCLASSRTWQTALAFRSASMGSLILFPSSTYTWKTFSWEKEERGSKTKEREWNYGLFWPGFSKSKLGRQWAKPKNCSVQSSTTFGQLSRGSHYLFQIFVYMPNLPKISRPAVTTMKMLLEAEKTVFSFEPVNLLEERAIWKSTEAQKASLPLSSLLFYSTTQI